MTDDEWQQARTEGWREAREHYARELGRLSREMSLGGWPHGFAQGVAMASVKIRDGEL